MTPETKPGLQLPLPAPAPKPASQAAATPPPLSAARATAAFVTAGEVRASLVPHGDIRGEIAFQNDVNALLAAVEEMATVFGPRAPGGTRRLLPGATLEAVSRIRVITPTPPPIPLDARPVNPFERQALFDWFLRRFAA